MKLRHPLVLGVALVLLVACKTLGLPQAQSFDQRLAYGYALHTALQNTAADGVTTGQISGADGQGVLKLADDSRAFLDTARIASSAGDPATAAGRLTLAITVMTQVQTYLCEVSKKKNPNVVCPTVVLPAGSTTP